MADIPAPATSPIPDALISEWDDAVAKADYWKEKELELRLKIFGTAFPTPKVGANKIRINYGMALVGTHRINYKVDKPAILTMYNQDNVRPIVDKVINFRPEVKEGEYKKLTPDDLKLIAEAITETPGTPALEVKSASKLRW